MKKSCYMLLISASVLSLTILGCGSAPPAAQPASLTNVPDWYLNPPLQEDVIFGTGSANFNDMNSALGAAEQRARVSIARTLNDNIRAMVTDYSRTAGTASEQTSLQFYESISQSVTNTTLKGVQVYKRAYENGVAYVVVSLKKADAAQAAADIIESEASQYAEFKAMNALAAMNAQLANSEVKPVAQEN